MAHADCLSGYVLAFHFRFFISGFNTQSVVQNPWSAMKFSTGVAAVPMMYLYLLVTAAFLFTMSLGLQQQHQQQLKLQNSHCAAATAIAGLVTVVFQSPFSALAIAPIVGDATTTTPMMRYNNNNIIGTKTVDDFMKPPKQRREIIQLQYLEDARLKQCEEKGKYWDQCFIFGTDIKKHSNEKDEHNNNNKNRPPTW
jgi:hypothetical protein